MAFARTPVTSSGVSSCGGTAQARIEARGFIFGSPIALAIGAKFVPLRKPKKLPGKVISQEHILEYGRDCLEMHVGLELLNLDLMLGVADLHTLEAVATAESAISTFLQSAEFAAAESAES
ncbi:Adenine phosphoribosyltransferase 1, chloroplastic [Glycine soja]|uniref:adenine phosphoribosyltransferase n=1 Tax=Glycine soja TaxID=3848 RepID=A0A0B2SF16_GLYSO|nr:Adenine phosphoribosyltransferase 1, chloroplastic [Glycine soja]